MRRQFRLLLGSPEDSLRDLFLIFAWVFRDCYLTCIDSHCTASDPSWSTNTDPYTNDHALDMNDMTSQPQIETNMFPRRSKAARANCGSFAFANFHESPSFHGAPATFGTSRGYVGRELCRRASRTPHALPCGLIKRNDDGKGWTRMAQRSQKE